MNEETNSYHYEERFTAFLDILGFSELMERTATVPPEVSIERIIAALDVPGPAEKGQLVIGNIGDISESGHKLAQFSDSIIISTECTKAGLMNLINHVEKIAFSFLKLGFLCRGGVSKGLLYHDKNNAFGPAMVAAYDLEHKKAKFPRIILSKNVEDFALSMDGGEGSVIKNMIVKYKDCHIVHVLRQLAFQLDMAGDGGGSELLYLEIKSHLIRETNRLKDNKKKHMDDPEKLRDNQNKLDKVDWFNEYFNQTVYADPIKVMQAVMHHKKGTV